MRPPRLSRSARLVPAACLVAILPFAGCSDDKDPDTTAGPTTSAVFAPPSTRTVDTTFTGEGSEEFCTLIETFTTGSQSVGPGQSVEDLEANLNSALDAINQAVEVAPDEIRPDITSIAGGFRTVVDTMAAAGYDVTKVDASALNSLNEPTFLDSVARLQAYLTNICRSGG